MRRGRAPSRELRSGMIRMASCQGQGFLVTLVTVCIGAAALGEEGMLVL